MGIHPDGIGPSLRSPCTTWARRLWPDELADAGCENTLQPTSQERLVPPHFLQGLSTFGDPCSPGIRPSLECLRVVTGVSVYCQEGCNGGKTAGRIASACDHIGTRKCRGFSRCQATLTSLHRPPPLGTRSDAALCGMRKFWKVWRVISGARVDTAIGDLEGQGSRDESSRLAYSYMA